MNPQQQMPSDYLDQIAAPTQKGSLLSSNRNRLIGISAVLIVLVIIASIAAGAFSTSRKEPWNVLVARIGATEEIATSATSLLKSNQLRSINSEVKLYLTNTRRDIAEPLLVANIDTAKTPASVLAEESAEPALQRLENARLNAVYDRAYAREMTYQLTRLLLAVEQAYDVSRTAATQQTLEGVYTNLNATLTSLSEYNAVEN